jgi:TonB family protein
MFHMIGVLGLFLFGGLGSLEGTASAQLPPGPPGVGTGAANVNGNRGAMGSITFAATGEKNYDFAPRWLRTPTPRSLGSVYPVQALQQGRNGSAVLKCVLTEESVLSGCEVVSESPGNQGFGYAALTLAPDLNIRPAMKLGHPVRTELTLNVSFIAPPPAIGSYLAGVDTSGLQKFLTNPAWERAPTYSQVVAAYPARARSANKSGRVSMDCTLGADGLFTSCLVMNEEPVGYGFGAAAADLAKSFKANPTLPGGGSVAGGVVKVPFTFTTRMLSPGQPATSTPVLTAVPSTRDLAAAFPRAARTAGIGHTQAALDCVVGQNGALSGCRAIVEKPAGFNVAMGAMQLASKYRVSPWSAEGLPVAGARVRVPIDYNLAAR